MAYFKGGTDIVIEEYHCPVVNEEVLLTRHYFTGNSEGKEVDRILKQTKCPKIDFCQLKGKWKCPQNIYA